MTESDDVRRLRKGIRSWNRWQDERGRLPYRERKKTKRPDLSGIDLSNRTLDGVDFYRVDLRDANLRNAHLYNANLHLANLEGADLRGAKLMGADLLGATFKRANLRNAGLQVTHARAVDFSFADLRGSNLQLASIAEAQLEGTDFSGSRMGRTSFADLDLSKAKGLESVVHVAPSSVGLDVLLRSAASIPDVFLRGVGLPDAAIAYTNALASTPIRFYSCFISHSSRDAEFCGRLYADLQARGLRVWYFPETAKWGEPVWAEIDRSIHVYDKLIVVCSARSLRSQPVLREIERALRREDAEGKQILFPITIDQFVFGDWKHERRADVLAKVVGDFRGWSRSTSRYRSALERLLNNLQAS